MPSPATAPLLSIIIVSWNVRDLLRTCLQSLQRVQSEMAFEVIVVDGGSADSSPDMVATEFPWVRLIVSQENLGFPRGNNVGLAQARGEYILLLNPDTEMFPQALSRMLAYLSEHDDVGLVGPQLLNPDKTIQSSRRRFPTLVTGLLESTWLEKFAPQAVLQRYYALDLPLDQIHDVDWVTGACMLTRRSVVVQVGEMDEAYFMYSEELDWCRRIKDAGWRVVYLPEAKVLHHVGKSSEQAVTARHINFQRAKLRYFRKYHGRTAAAFLRLFLLLNYLIQMKVEAIKGILGHKRPLRWQRVQAYWQVLRSGLPPAGE